MLTDSRNKNLNSKLFHRIENISNRSHNLHWQTVLRDLHMNLTKKYLYLNVIASMTQVILMLLYSKDF